MQHKYSTYALIVFILLSIIVIVTGLDSSEIDDICDTDEALLYRTDGFWGCGLVSILNLWTNNGTFISRAGNVDIANNLTLGENLFIDGDIVEVSDVHVNDSFNVTGDATIGGTVTTENITITGNAGLIFDQVQTICPFIYDTTLGIGLTGVCFDTDNNQYRMYVGNDVEFSVDSGDGDINAAQYIRHLSDSDTLIGFSSNDVLILETDGQRMLTADGPNSILELGNDGTIDIKLSAGTDGALTVLGATGDVLIKENLNITKTINATEFKGPNLNITSVNNSIGNIRFFQYNSSCDGWRKGTTGGIHLSCD